MNKNHLTTQQLEAYIPGWGWTTHIKVQRLDGRAGISWDQLQEIKSEIAGPDARAIEIFPADCDVVNEANIRHLWIVPDGIPLPNLKRR